MRERRAEAATTQMGRMDAEDPSRIPGWVSLHQGDSIIEPSTAGYRAGADSHSILGLAGACLPDLLRPGHPYNRARPPLTIGSRHFS